MDGHRFDDLTRALVKRANRRGFLAGVASLFGGLAARADAAAACPAGQYSGSGGRCLCRSSGRPSVGGVCPCPSGTTDCGGTCVDTSRDALNCGGCGQACPPRTCQGPPSCLGGACGYAPAADGTPCDDGNAMTCNDVCTAGVCAGTPKDLQTDVANCGTCGNACSGDVCNTPDCQSGTCTTVPVVCADDGNPCTTERCDAASGGCISVNNTDQCTTGSGKAGRCTGGICCSSFTTGTAECTTSAECGSGQSCVNGGCFTACSGFGDPCSAFDDCTECVCHNSTDPPGGFFCLPLNFLFGKCSTNSDCPAGSLCNAAVSYPDGSHLCGSPCPTPS